MTNSPKDFDQGSVNADAAEMYEREMGEIGDTMDGADLYTVLALIADAEGIEFASMVRSSLGRDIISMTQSNLNEIDERLIRMHELDNAISEL